MSATRDTRKPIDELTLGDLDAFPIWEFATDEEDVEGQDETWVRPLVVEQVPRGTFSLSVAADFVASCGQNLGGFVDVTTAMALVGSEGVVLHRGKYLYIPAARSRAERQKFANDIGLTEIEIFPLQFTLRVLVEAEDVLRTGAFA